MPSRAEVSTVSRTDGDAGAMAFDARQVALRRPAAVAVHDDRDVARQPVAVDLPARASPRESRAADGRGCREGHADWAGILAVSNRPQEQAVRRGRRPGLGPVAPGHDRGRVARPASGRGRSRPGVPTIARTMWRRKPSPADRPRRAGVRRPRPAPRRVEPRAGPHGVLDIGALSTGTRRNRGGRRAPAAPPASPRGRADPGRARRSATSKGEIAGPRDEGSGSASRAAPKRAWKVGVDRLDREDPDGGGSRALVPRWTSRRRQPRRQGRRWRPARGVDAGIGPAGARHRHPAPRREPGQRLLERPWTDGPSLALPAGVRRAVVGDRQLGRRRGTGYCGRASSRA